MDCASLTDEELGQMLKDYGIDVGPINIATRGTYERKLNKLKTGQASPPSQKYEPVDDDDDDDDEVQLRVPATSTPSMPSGRGTPSSIPVPTQVRSRVLDASSTPKLDQIDSRPPLYSARSSTSTYSRAPQASRGDYQTMGTPMVDPQKLAESKKGGIPAWVKLIVFCVMALLGYLIYSNLEPDARSNIPSLPNKVEV